MDKEKKKPTEAKETKPAAGVHPRVCGELGGCRVSGLLLSFSACKHKNNCTANANEG